MDPGPSGGIDDIKEIASAMKECREKILVLQQLSYSVRADGKGEVTCWDVYTPLGTVPGCERPQTLRPPLTLVNGVYAPTITMRPGEVQRWRCIHAGVQAPITLAVKSVTSDDRLDLHELAADGLPLRAITTSSEKQILLYPGYRTDFLIKAPPAAGEYVLINAPNAAAVPLKKAPLRAVSRIIARVSVTGPALDMDLPQPSTIEKYALKPIEDDELFNRIPYKIEFNAEDPAFTVNGQEFEHDRIDIYPRLGYPEEWELRSKNDNHPFHIHVNPFEVTTKDASGKITCRIWKDTILVTPNAPVFIRSRFEDFGGKTVLHCHNLVHEDRGMMSAIEFVGTDTLPSRCVETPSSGMKEGSTAADWRLPDSTGAFHTLKQFEGQSLLLVFFRGMACSHCRRQLDAFAAHADALAKVNVKVVAVCPDSPGSLAQAKVGDPQVGALPFLILSDEDQTAFRAYGCFDGHPLHGVFAIDGDATVKWHAVGEEPFMEIDALLAMLSRVFKGADERR